MIKRIDSAAVVLAAVRDTIARRGLTSREAAGEIGVQHVSLARHLDGTIVATPTAVERYREWADSGDKQQELPGALRGAGMQEAPNTNGASAAEGEPRGTPYRVVDLFAGCGGLSLGFDMYGEGKAFETILAMDIDQPMVSVFNANSPGGVRGTLPVARRVDLEQFSNDSEILAFYLDHLARREHDLELERGLQKLPAGSLGEFRTAICEIDARFHETLRAIRAQNAYTAECRGVLPHTFSQTSVEEFFRRLRIPLMGPRWMGHPILWQQEDAERAGGQSRRRGPGPDPASRRRARVLWKREVARLQERVDEEDSKAKSKARRKIASFLATLSSAPFEELRKAWIDWTAARTQLRRHFFEAKEEATLASLRRLYAGDRRVDVILGGPPCQGFSRVGRGKLRSLREEGAHVQADEDAGDERNLLLYKYVQFASALEPSMFLFENVATFKSHVRTAQGSFDAVETLEQAFDEISDHRIHYEIGIRTIQCADHGLPQFRARFFMAGVRSVKGGEGAGRTKRLAEGCLLLPLRESHLPLKYALSGLPEAKQDPGQRIGTLVHACNVEREGDGGFDLAQEYLRWIRRPLDGSPPGRSARWTTDAHVARLPRVDDREWFRRMGPGMRWMDYRCDDAPTLRALVAALGRLGKLLDSADEATRVPVWVREALAGLAAELDDQGLTLSGLAKRLDGSLSIRLLLEGLTARHDLPRHHLIRPVYLTKKPGHHGDWLKRLDPEMPCRTVVSHMAKDTYPYVHPTRPRMLSVREAARAQTFPDAFSFARVGIFHAFRMIGNAVPPMLSNMLAARVATALSVGTTLARERAL